jgi:hypothetical protein
MNSDKKGSFAGPGGLSASPFTTAYIEGLGISISQTGLP